MGLCPFSFLINYYTDVDAEKRKSRQNQIFRAMEHEINWFELVDELQKLEEKLPYHINLIQMLGAKENTHTKILVKLLQYKENGNYPILQSFLNYISENYGISPFFVQNPQIKREKEHIDSLIIDKDKIGNRYAIIIENKINWAPDQDMQIERYIKSVNGGSYNIPLKNIFVIYLTSNGTKKVSEQSFTRIAKEYLDFTENSQGRFIPMSYRYDILPWLKNSVLPNCKMKEEYLVSTLQQYIDYFEKRFGLCQIDKEINNMEKDLLLSRMGIKDCDSISQIFQTVKKNEQALAKLQEKLCNIKDDILRDARQAEEKFNLLTQDFFKILFSDTRHIIIKNAINNDKGFYFFHAEEWEWQVQFEWYSLSIAKLIEGHTYTLELHTEDKYQSFKEVLLKDEDFKKIVEQIDGNTNFNDKVTVFRKVYHIAKPFAEMTHEEQKAFLEMAYKDVTPMIPIIDRLLTEYKKK